MTFNALLDAAVKLDASRWTQKAWIARAAYHAEQAGFQKFVSDSWGKQSPGAEKPKKGIQSLIRDFGGGI